MDNVLLSQELRKIGLPEKAALVYAFLLDSGIGFPSKIAERTKLNRSTVYHTLNELVARQLVSKVERGRKLCFQVEKPAHLVGFAKQQIQIAENRLERAVQLLPELESLYKLTPNKPKVSFFEGLAGILAVYADQINQTEPYEMVSYSNVEELFKLLPEKFTRDYIKKKQEKRITTRAIFPDSAFSHNYNKQVYRGIEKKFLVERRFIPVQDFPYKAEIAVYGTNKISIINFVERTLTGVIIEDTTIAGMLRMIFELAWRAAK